MNKSTVNTSTVNTNAVNKSAVNKRLSRQFAFTVSLLIVLAMCSFWLISHNNTRALLRQQADDLGAALAQQTAIQLTELVLANDLVSMNVILRGVTEAAAIAEVAVLNVDAVTLASVRQTRTPPALILPLPLTLEPVQAEYRAPIRLADSVAGTVRLRLDLGYIEAALINNLILIIGVTLLLVIAAALLTSIYFQTLVSFPARLLAFSLGNIRQGRIDTCPEPKGGNELAVAIRQYNATAQFLTEHTFLGRFGADLPESATDAGVPQPGQQEVTLLAIRLANFEYLASTQPRDEMVKLLNRFYFYCGKVSQLYNGTIGFCANGDVLINFSGQALEEEQAFYAICAGQLFLHLVDDLSVIDERPIAVKFRLAVHSGLAVTGLYSPASGNNDNLMGSSLDLAWQMCDSCPDNDLLISATALELAGAGSRVEVEYFAEAGDPDPVATYLACPPMSEYRLLIERQADQLASLYGDRT
ncbi:MAG: hypothetical protein WD396_10880 [Pseudohongiellaceae bacterium]